jgi:hypothetical protein
VPGTLFDAKYRLVLPSDVDLELAEVEARRVFREGGGRTPLLVGGVLITRGGPPPPPPLPFLTAPPPSSQCQRPT